MRFEIVTMNFEGLDSWRNFFKDANTSIFEIIENAIKVAAKDYTEEFKLQRRVIVDTVYSCWFTLHCGHHHSDLMQQEKTKQEIFKERPVNWDAKTRVNGNAVDLKANGSSETKYDSCRGDLDMRLAHRSKYSYKEAEELVEEIDEENGVIVEVLRIKAILNNSHEEVCPTCCSRTNSNLGFSSLKIVQGFVICAVMYIHHTF